MVCWLYRNLNEKIEKLIVSEPRRSKLTSVPRLKILIPGRITGMVLRIDRLYNVGDHGNRKYKEYR